MARNFLRFGVAWLVQVARLAAASPGPGRSSTSPSTVSMRWAIRLLLAVCAVVLVGCGPRSGQGHVFQLKERPKMLTEELALEHARQALAKEGYNLQEWPLIRADNPPTEAPDGTPDKYFDRFSFRPTEGRVHFTDGKVFRTVQVRWEDDRIVCFMFRGL